MAHTAGKTQIRITPIKSEQRDDISKVIESVIGVALPTIDDEYGRTSFAIIVDTPTVGDTIENMDSQFSSSKLEVWIDYRSLDNDPTENDDPEDFTGGE